MGVSVKFETCERIFYWVFYDKRVKIRVRVLKFPLPRLKIGPKFVGKKFFSLQFLPSIYPFTPSFPHLGGNAPFSPS